MGGWTCPACGTNSLEVPARDEKGKESREICQSCGFQFGVTDDVEGYTYNQWWREKCAIFDYDDSVTAKPGADKKLRPGEMASVVGVIRKEKRKGKFLEEFPEGNVYTIEFNDGSSVDAKEDDLMFYDEEVEKS